MITDFPEVRQHLMNFLTRLGRDVGERNAGILSLANKKLFAEGDRMGIVRENGEYSTQPFKIQKVEFSVPTSGEPEEVQKKFIEEAMNAATEMAKEQQRNMMDTIVEAVHKVGNSFEAKSKAGPEVLLEGLEKLPIHFEDNDRHKPVMPSLIASQKIAQAFIDAENKMTPEQRADIGARKEQILDKKFKEHMADFNSRKLVD